MCLLFGLSETRNIPKGDLSRLIRAVNKSFSATQRDGFGFALWDSVKGAPYIERYVGPGDFAGVGQLPNVLEQAGWMNQFAYYDEYNIAGEWASVVPTGPLIVHGRTSTSAVNIANTHPFTKRGWTLIHNGIVDWRGPKLPLESTCDSEHLLNCYAYQEGPISYAENISGWFATMAISPAGHLHVAKCVRTDLFFAYSQKWRTYLFSTTADFLQKLNRSFKLKMHKPLELEPLVELVFSGNECAGIKTFRSPSVMLARAADAAKALGKTPTVVFDDDDDERGQMALDTANESQLRNSDIDVDDLDPGTVEHAADALQAAGWFGPSDLSDMTDVELMDHYRDMMVTLAPQ